MAEISTRLGPLELLDALQCEETRQGRRRDAVRWAPRTIDLDLLIYGETSIHDERLTVPHPELARRPFAIYPLHELAPDLHIPGLGALAALWRGMPDASMTPVGRAMIPVVGEAGVDCANG